ncbi:MAG: alpha/beta fold hydrolase [Solirubrobacteraceae bacterium]
MSVVPEPLPLYLEGTGEPVFATLHPARAEGARDTAVVICPPFGWPEVSSYRPLRAWAQHLAAAGYSALRISLPSTGDSGGDAEDPERLDAWCAALTESCSWLRARASARRVTVIGLGLGGLIACRAAAGTAPVDELVLWATPARGRAIVRELKATSRVEAAQCFDTETPPPPVPEGELDVSGFQLSAETVAALSGLDVQALSFADGSPSRALLLDRDGTAVDQGLQDWLRRGGVEVTTARGAGYGAMTTHPQQTQAPVDVFARTTVWLGEASSPATSTATAPGPLVQSTRIEWASGALMERPIFIDLPSGRLPGVLSEPIGPGRPGVCALLLNAGGIRRIGPGRMWVEAARRWALQGVPTIRLDLEGIGDADGELNPYAYDGALYVPKLTAQAAGAVQALHELGLGDRFVLGGLCSGAFWSFHVALEDPRVIGAYLLNPRALFWEQSIQPARDFRRGVLNPSKWRKLRLIPRARYAAFARWVLASPVRVAAGAIARVLGRRSPDRVGPALDKLSATGTHLMLLFSDHEPLYEELSDSGLLSRLEQWPNITLERVQGRDHTLRPLISQRQAHEALDRALARDLAAMCSRSEPRSGAVVHDRAA